MKCTRCGAEVEAQRFCIYCGERLQGHHVTAKPVRAPSGVMRFKQRASVSQSSLPKVQNRQASRMELESLKRSSSENKSLDLTSLKASGEAKGAVMADIGNEQTTRQSRELEALLLKLNGHDEAAAEEPGAIETDDEVFSSLDIDIDHSLSEEVGMEDRSLDESFFLRDESEAAVSGPIPMGSGSFSRVPSGGFHLVVDSIKSACSKAIHKVRHAVSGKGQSSRTASVPQDKRKKFIGAAAAGAVVIAVIGILASGGNQEETEKAELAAQQPVNGNEDFAILPLDEADPEIADVKFDAEDFSIPAFEGDGLVIGAADEDEIDVEAAAAAAKAAATGNIAQPTETAKAGNKTLTEKRQYGRKDNVFAGKPEGQSIKTNKSCIMREGPASRFGLVKQIGKGASIQVIATTEEDWVLEVGGLWAKSGQTKLGPGSMFADAVKGMTVPQPKSRVISAKNWRYVKSGDVYGYVGPACFK